MSFLQLTSSGIPLPWEDMRINQILPTRFSSWTKGFDLAEKLFYDLRFEEDGQVNHAFVLNNPAYAGNILVTGKEFGIGTKTEMAVLALLDYGIKAIVSSSFASEFKHTAKEMGLVLVELKPSYLHHLIIAIHTNPKLQLRIDLETQALEVPELNLEFKFKLNPYELLCQMYSHPQYDLMTKLEQKV